MILYHILVKGNYQTVSRLLGDNQPTLEGSSFFLLCIQRIQFYLPGVQPGVKKITTYKYVCKWLSITFFPCGPTRA